MRLFIILSSIISLGSHAMEPNFYQELDLPKAKGITSGKVVISREEFNNYNKYFKNINTIEKADIQYDIEDSQFGHYVTENEIAFVAMNDSCLAQIDSGVKIITLDNLVDCVGIFLYHPEAGAAAAHVTIGTKLSSLTNILSPFAGKADTKIMILTSWKTKLLTNIIKEIKKYKELKVGSIFVNNVIQQSSPDQSVIKRYFDPDELGITKKHGKKISYDTFCDLVDDKYSAPIAAVIDVLTGRVSFLKIRTKKNCPHTTSAFIKTSHEAIFNKPFYWAAQRYINEVKPNEDKLDVDIAFVQFPLK